MTFEKLLADMLVRIPSDMDKREGSIIYDALAPAALELANIYAELEWLLRQGFADTADREYLIKRCKERGIEPYRATKAIFKGFFDAAVPTGARFNLGGLNYCVTEQSGANEYQVICETAGEIGNRQMGDLVPIEYISGLASAKLTQLLIPGEDEEATEHLRSRYFASLEAKAFGGNIADYKEKADAIQGVGGVKVTPVWNGGGTVKLTILSSENLPPAEELVALVQNEIDPPPQGTGLGLAPIGHTVTVCGAQAVIITVNAALTFQDGTGWEDIKPEAEKAVNEYFASLRSQWAGSASLIVRISQIETRLLSLDGVLDIQGTAINGNEKNIQLPEDSVPILGEINGG